MKPGKDAQNLSSRVTLSRSPPFHREKPSAGHPSVRYPVGSGPGSRVEWRSPTHVAGAGLFTPHSRPPGLRPFIHAAFRCTRRRHHSVSMAASATHGTAGAPACPSLAVECQAPIPKPSAPRPDPLASVFRTSHRAGYAPSVNVAPLLSEYQRILSRDVP